ncbi:hypothetical protein R3P38DRAFT_3208582 [Favolaschia claudopus]|uniref:Uncharacterized protein n=1 Tax=Favolaschia claudopus TaxID=2862362 RepID=A0AAW0AJR0_9AGAR
MRYVLRTSPAASAHIFLRERPGPPIYSQHPYNIADAFSAQNCLVLQREDKNLCYRGEKHSRAQCTSASCIRHFRLDGEDKSRSPSPTPTEDAANAVDSRAASLTPTELVQSESDRAPSPKQDLDAEMPPPNARGASNTRTVSPTVTELLESDSDREPSPEREVDAEMPPAPVDVPVRPLSPASSQFFAAKTSTAVAPAWPPSTLTTTTSVDAMDESDTRPSTPTGGGAASRFDDDDMLVDTSPEPTPMDEDDSDPPSPSLGSGNRYPRTLSPTVTELGGALLPPPPIDPRYVFAPHASDYNSRRFDLAHARTLRYFEAKQVVAVARYGPKKAQELAELAKISSLIPSPSRQSRRHRQGRRDDLSAWGVVDADVLKVAGFDIHELPAAVGPRPMLDGKGFVIGAFSSGPSKPAERIEWLRDVAKVGTHLGRVKRQAIVWPFGASESRLPYGLTHAYPNKVPGPIVIEGFDEDEMQALMRSPALQRISAYQMHLLEQFFPKAAAVARRQIAELRQRTGASTPFEDQSAFTTGEIHFCDAPALSRQNRDAAFNMLEAITVVGRFNNVLGGQLILSESDGALRFPSGSTAVFPAGTVEYGFAAVAKDEVRFLVRQYFSAGVLRWVEMGGRTDREFEEKGTVEERMKWETKRLRRGETSTKMYSKLQELDYF